MRIRNVFAKGHRSGPHVPIAADAAAALSLSRVCNLEDFAHPALRETIRAVFPHDCERFGADFPIGREYRKHWEVALAVKTLTDLGAVRDDAEILGVGAGNEPTLFWLTNRVRRVFATDRYLIGDDWTTAVQGAMLVDPARHWPSAWNPRRLVVQHMNPLDLRFENNSIDGIFTCDTIEHLPRALDVRRAMAEMYRVLKPGGVLSLATQFRLTGPAPGMPGTLLFNEDELHEKILGGQPWELAEPFDPAISEATLATAVDFHEATAEVDQHLRAYGQLLHHRLEWSRYPHLVLRAEAWTWTSAHLALRKPR
ncbi:MAG: class I SAM-dependent methyltransferase [Isosphaeraceae bacterium]|nr:class I SAM-dependent methyltransferase [Isosphaeraceae bacterium]